MKFSNGTWNHKAVIAIALTSLFFGCAKKEEETPSTGEVTVAQLEGTRWGSCTAVSGSTYGSAVNGMSYMRGLTFQSDGTYAITTLFFTGTTCAFGGDNVFTMSQAGTFEIGEVQESGATQIIYTTAGSVLTTFAGTSAGGTTWAGNFNDATCTGGPDLVVDTNATDTNTVTGLSCSDSSPDFAFPEFAPAGTVFYDLVTLSGSTLTVGDLAQLWNIGQVSSYPTSATQQFIEY
ncbi:hypothetical protein [Bdellovibrio bacteriovorus]|uniref:Lipoprotein n=1 Tax=Bdellovibrio bacteriovorus TaxID=959 RepID=A0A1Z3NBF9_BDEBC|nr:hypothetical protein [Bdellovibrio bacteriovorus]ASD64798.1 hypothetical protein B9G79_15125 [Bdellovibrio bacteriovorus]